jgi:hypothetical protein
MAIILSIEALDDDFAAASYRSLVTLSSSNRAGHGAGDEQPWSISATSASAQHLDSFASPDCSTLASVALSVYGLASDHCEMQSRSLSATASHVFGSERIPG